MPWPSPTSVYCVLLTAAGFSLVGCGDRIPAALTSSSTSSQLHPYLQGRALGGQQPVTGSSVMLYAAGTAADGSASLPLLAQPVLTDSSGNFSIPRTFTCPQSSSLLYVAATGGNPGLSNGTKNLSIAMLAVLGGCDQLSKINFIDINELTTVAAVSALYPWMTSATSVGALPAHQALLAQAFATALSSVNIATGTAPGASVPSGVTIPVIALQTLGDILAACINSPGGTAGDSTPCGRLFSLTSTSGIDPPADTATAVLFLNRYPSSNVAALFNLITPSAPFQPTLPSPPESLAIQPSSSALPGTSSSYLSFPVLVPGEVSFPQTIGLSNPGTSALTVSSLDIVGPAGSDFHQTSYCGSGVLQPGGSCSVSLTFLPTAPGPRSAALELSIPGLSVPVPLLGASTAALSLPAPTAD